MPCDALLALLQSIRAELKPMSLVSLPMSSTCCFALKDRTECGSTKSDRSSENTLVLSWHLRIEFLSLPVVAAFDIKMYGDVWSQQILAILVWSPICDIL